MRIHQSFKQIWCSAWQLDIISILSWCSMYSINQVLLIGAADIHWCFNKYVKYNNLSGSRTWNVGLRKQRWTQTAYKCREQAEVKSIWLRIHKRNVLQQTGRFQYSVLIIYRQTNAVTWVIKTFQLLISTNVIGVLEHRLQLYSSERNQDEQTDCYWESLVCVVKSVLSVLIS